MSSPLLQASTRSAIHCFSRLWGYFLGCDVSITTCMTVTMLCKYIKFHQGLIEPLFSTEHRNVHKTVKLHLHGNVNPLFI